MDGAAFASSPRAAAVAVAELFRPVAGGNAAGGGMGGAMPKGEVHMDEINLIEG